MNNSCYAKSCLTQYGAHVYVNVEPGSKGGLVGGSLANPPNTKHSVQEMHTSSSIERETCLWFQLIIVGPVPEELQYWVDP